MSEKIINPGKWYTVFDEQGNCIEAVYDKSYCRLLGIDSDTYENTTEQWMESIYPDDRPAIGQIYANILSKDSKDLEYDMEYRIMTKWGYRWFHDYGRCVRREDGSLARCDGYVIDIQNIKDTETLLAHNRLKTEVLDYIINNDNDPIDLLKTFAERIRVLLGCDQVIYRDLKETRIMVNSPEIEKTWAVPLEYCQQCQHFDAHHEMYKDGYTEMDNCQEGWKGIPVYHKCPIKSSLTRIIYCDKEIAGYLAIHYVTKYHHFTEIEEETLKEFARILSLSISRYEAKKTSQKLDSFRRTMSTIFSLSDYDPIIVLDPITGEYNWLMSLANDVENNTSMDVHGDDLYKNIGIDSANIIHKDDRTKFQAFYTRDNMLQIAETGESQTTENRWYIETMGEYRYKYNKAVRMFDDKGKAFVVIGVIDTTEQKRKEAKIAEQQQENIAQKELIENNKRFFALEDNLESLYDVELDSGHYEVFVKGDFYRNNVLDKLVSEHDYFLDLQDNINTVIYEDDREGLFNALTRESIVKELSTKDHFDYVYRIKTPNGPIWFKVRVVYKNEQKKSVIFGVFNVEDDIETTQIKEQKARIEEALTFTNFFLDTYVSAYYVNLEDLTCQVYKRTNELDKKYPIINDYFASLKDYIERDVHPDDRNILIEIVKPQNMRKHLKKEAQFNHIFRDISYGIEKTYRMQVIRGASEKHAAFGFIDITKEANEQAERLEEIEKNKKLITSIASSYHVAYAVDLKTDQFVSIRFDDDIIGYGEKFKTFAEAKEFFLSILPAMDARKMRYELDYKVIRKKLKVDRSYDVEYRVLIKGAMLWHVMNVTLIDEDRVAICFARRDIEITKKHLEEKRYNEYFALYEIDIDNNMMKIVKDSPWYGIDRAGKAIPYTDAMIKFANTLDTEPKEFFLKLANLDYVRELMRREDKHTYAYRSNNVGKKEWVDSTSYVTLRHEDGTPAMFSIGFSLVDSLGIFRQELQTKYKEALDIVSEEKQRNDALHDIIHSGKWSFTFNEKDELISSFYSDEVMKVVDNDLSTGATMWTELLHPDDKEEAMKAFYATVKDHTCKTPYDVTYRMKNRYGEYHWFHSAGRIVRNKEGMGEFFGIHIDITAQIEEQLKQHEELEKAMEEAASANRSKSSFLFNMSHDIRTPLNAIRGFTSMAKKHIDEKERVREYLDKIDISGDQLLTLINQVLEMARIESGKIEFNYKSLDVTKEFNSMVTILSEQAATSGLNFEYHLTDIKHPYILADEARIGSITLNIVGNAMKYTPEGGKIYYELKEIEPRKKGYASFLFTVEDTGIGMSEEYQKIIFEPFTRENNSTISKIQGTGLGLSIVKSFVDLLHGDIRVKSKLGEGTRFDVILDFKIDTNTLEDDKAKEEYNIASFKGKRILLVEDNEMNREIATDILTEYGFIIETAEDGDVAVDKIQHRFLTKDYKYYDFVLMDVQMPRMNGYQATETIRKLPVPTGFHLPIIAMTANAFEEDRKDAIEAGMDDHCTKPIDIQSLLATLYKFL